jgi:DNA-binding PadR family transcriptional regulator
MLTFLTKDADIEAIKADILTTLSGRNFEAEALHSRLPWKVYHVEMALHELLRDGLLVSYWTDSGRSQRQFYALTQNFDSSQSVMQIRASSDTLEKFGDVNITSRREIQRARAERQQEAK